jgi:hypothetical protein
MACGRTGIETGPAVECKIPWSLGERCGSCKGHWGGCVCAKLQGWKVLGDGEAAWNASRRLSKGLNWRKHSVAQQGLLRAATDHGNMLRSKTQEPGEHQGRSRQIWAIRDQHCNSENLGSTRNGQKQKQKAGGLARAGVDWPGDRKYLYSQSRTGTHHLVEQREADIPTPMGWFVQRSAT